MQLTPLRALQVMTPEELSWVDAYHAEVRERVSPRLQHLPEVLQWLETNTAPLDLANGKAPKVRSEAGQFVLWG